MSKFRFPSNHTKIGTLIFQIMLITNNQVSLYQYEKRIQSLNFHLLVINNLDVFCCILESLLFRFPIAIGKIATLTALQIQQYFSYKSYSYDLRYWHFYYTSIRQVVTIQLYLYTFIATVSATVCSSIEIEIETKYLYPAHMKQR